MTTEHIEDAADRLAEGPRAGLESTPAAGDAGLAGLACSLVTIGLIGAVAGLLWRPRRRRPWPAMRRVIHPSGFTPPHGDTLSAHR